MAPPPSTGGGRRASPPKLPARADFLDARTNATFADRIAKEERALHKLLQAQLELGHLQLPADDGEPSRGGDSKAAAPADGEPSPAAVERHTQWLLAARRAGGGSGDSVAAAAGADTADGGAAATSVGRAATDGPRAPPGATCSASPAAVAPTAEEDEAAMKAQLQAISRSLWSSVSAGSASGSAGGASSTAAAAYRYSPERVVAMAAAGELSPAHRRRRDEHTQYMEAQARDALLRRGAAASGGEAK